MYALFRNKKREMKKYEIRGLKSEIKTLDKKNYLTKSVCFFRN